MGQMELLVTASENVVYLPFVGIDFSTIVFTLINTLIIFLIYRFFLHNKVMAVLEQRQKKINEEMDAAEKAQQEAEAVKAEYAQRLEQSKEEANRIVADAVKKAGAREAEIIAEAEENARQIRVRAEENIEQEKKRALNEVKDQISDVVIMAASAVCEKEISAEDNGKLIDSFLVNVGKEG